MHNLALILISISFFSASALAFIILLIILVSWIMDGKFDEEFFIDFWLSFLGCPFFLGLGLWVLS